jgi:phosphate acetyltransferase
MHTFFIAPTGFGVGLTSISLGLVRALERAGLKVGFFKPIAQPHPGDDGPERSTELIARTLGLTPPKPLELARVEHMLGDGQLDELLEEIISLYQQAAAGMDVLIVEGMVPTRHAATRRGSTCTWPRAWTPRSSWSRRRKATRCRK